MPMAAARASLRARRCFARHSPLTRPGQVLAAALLASLLVHLLGGKPAGAVCARREAPPPSLAATLTQMPPPPPPDRQARRRQDASCAGATERPGRRPDTALLICRKRQRAPPRRARPVPSLPPSCPRQPRRRSQRVAPDPAAPRPLPPRIELVYRGFLGTQGFFIGDAVYRLEHAANQYRITTVGQARGLAALFLRGQGRLTSTGTITREGLQPNLYTAERTSDGHHEAANFDWETGVVLLNDSKTAGLELPTFDPLTVLWQFYFTPPEQDDAEFNVATTRRVYHNRFHRVATETVKLSFGDFEAQVWERTGGDGNVSARVWLAPSLHNVMVKLRLSNGRITGEALLDSIRVDETVAQQ